MSSRQLDELATNIDDAATIANELEDQPHVDASEKWDELHKTLEDASNTIDELDNKDE